MSEPSVGRAFAVYSLLRLLLFAIVTAVLFLVGLTDLPLLATAVLVSAILSFVVLKPQREGLARAVAGRDGARQSRRDVQRAQLDETS